MSELKYHQLFSLEGKTAIVTGGLGILGKHFCMGLAEFGANVVIVDLNENEAELFADELRHMYKKKAKGIGCDISKPESIESTINRVIDEFGGINILHNNAQEKTEDFAKALAPFEDYELDEWRRVMSVNINGMFLMAQAVGKQMIKQGKGGSIIQTSSIYGIMGPDHRIYEGSFYNGHQMGTPVSYSVSKAAVVGLTKYLATYWAKYKIRVNTLIPGGVESGQNEEFLKKYSSRIPLNRMAKADEMVGALIYLASDASSYVTGQNIIVDGGLSAW